MDLAAVMHLPLQRALQVAMGFNCVVTAKHTTHQLLTGHSLFGSGEDGNELLLVLILGYPTIYSFDPFVLCIQCKKIEWLL